LSDRAIAERVKEAASMLELEEHLDKKPKELSGGQRQRVALGRALIRRPKVLLMDEPLSNLDAELRHQMRNEIRRLHDELGTTTIYVTHDQIEAMTLADRVAILDQGVLQQHAPPLEAYQQPANDFVKSFLCRHLDDLVETANTLLRPHTKEEGA
jgi:multiple sugar transport system ATP-binding protein